MLAFMWGLESALYKSTEEVLLSTHINPIARRAIVRRLAFMDYIKKPTHTKDNNIMNKSQTLFKLYHD